MRPPVLWHIPVSHYNEKVRWALDLKGVEHERRAPPPPAHIPVARWLTRGRASTFPLLVLDGQAIADSTAIIAALERRHPDPPLYPDDPAERERALELEEFFDEELGPHVRGLAFHEMRKDPAAIAAFAAPMLPGPLAGNATVRRLAGSLASAFSSVRYPVGGARGRRPCPREGRRRPRPAGGRARPRRGRVPRRRRLLGRRPDRGVALRPGRRTRPRAPCCPSCPSPYEAFGGRCASAPAVGGWRGMFARHRVGARRP